MLHGRPDNIVAVLRRDGGEIEVHKTSNIVTTAGDIYYAQSAAGESPTNAFNALHLGTGVVAPDKANDSDDLTLVASSGKAVSTNYPQTDDQDSDNTGAGVNVVTWKFEYGTSDANEDDITEGAIAVGTGALSADPLLTHFAFGAAFNKTSSDTLTVYVNHTAEGS